VSLSAETMDVLSRQGLLSPEQLADYLGVPLATVYKWRATGSGPRGYRVGRHVRFNPTEVARWLETQGDPQRVA